MSKREIRPGFLGVVDRVKYVVVAVLLIVLMLLVAVTTFELVIRLGASFVNGIGNLSLGEYLLAEEMLLDIVGLVLTVFIVIELAESVEVYLTENDFHAELVILVALIAVARKIILLDYDKYDSIVYIGIALIVASLAWAYWMLKRARQAAPGGPEPDTSNLIPPKVESGE